MLTGPLFTREAITVPRQLQHYLIRAGYVAGFLVLFYTIRQATLGFRDVHGLGDLARFGGLVFQIFSMVQLSLVLFFALLFAASRIAQEKDRQTLILLLMTDMRDRELVLGKLASSLLNVAVLLTASAPAFVLVYMLGGVALEQIGWSLAICAATGLVAGSWGALVAFWKDKTFQTLSIGVIGAVLWIGVVEAIVGIVGPETTAGAWLAVLDPYRAMLAVVAPLVQADGIAGARTTAAGCVVVMLAVAVALNAVSVMRLRVWNPSRSIFDAARKKEEQEITAGVRSRTIWSNPVVWREIRTRAYGRKVILIKLAYLLLAGFAFASVAQSPAPTRPSAFLSADGLMFVGLALLGLMLVNAQAVTSLTSERDGKTLELLLMTDISAREFIFGKLGGTFFNAKEVILVPLVFAVYFTVQGGLTVENLIYLTIGYFVLVTFAAMLGLHAGLSYDSSRAAIGNSLGTMFFLFVGVAIFMMLLVEARQSFFVQFQTFIAFIGVGGIGLWASLAHKNPSTALMISAFCLPFFTFYAITEFLLAGTLGVCLSVLVAYGFTTLAMAVPAVSEFDVALGRTTVDQG